MIWLEFVRETEILEHEAENQARVFLLQMRAEFLDAVAVCLACNEMTHCLHENVLGQDVLDIAVAGNIFHLDSVDLQKAVRNSRDTIISGRRILLAGEQTLVHQRAMLVAVAALARNQYGLLLGVVGHGFQGRAHMPLCAFS